MRRPRKHGRGSKKPARTRTAVRIQYFYEIINCSRIPEMLTVPFAVVTDPEDPKFDLEKLVAKWEQESK